MGFSLYNLFKAGLLITNGVAILHPKRFLAKVGYSYYDNNELNSSDSNPLKAQIVGLLQAVAYLKVPLIVVNSFVIVIEVLAGG